MIRRIFLYVLFLGLIIFGVVSLRNKTTELVIISTNDMHGSIDNMPALATLVNQIKAEGVTPLVLDAGDKWTGNPYVDLNAEKGKPMIELMNAVGFDATTVGNHGFDNGLATLAKRIKESKFATLSANMDSDTSCLEQLRPLTFFVRDGVKICVLGMLNTQREGYPDGKVENFGGVKFSDGLKIAPEYATYRDSCDVFIALTHLGAEQDSVLAQVLPQLDVIVGGHSHTVMPEGQMVNGVLMTQTGKGLKYAGVTRLKIKRGKVVGKSYSLVPLDSVAPNPEIAKMVAQYKNAPELMEVVGRLDSVMDKRLFSNLTADAIRDAVKSDFGFTNKNSVRLDKHAGGDFTVADLFSMEPFGNYICTHTMTLDQFKGLILNKFNTNTGEGHTLDICVDGGINYIIKRDAKGDGVDVLFSDSRGKPLTDMKRRYTISMPDYVSKTYNFKSEALTEHKNVVITEAVKEYFKRHNPVKPSAENRAKIE